MLYCIFFLDLSTDLFLAVFHLKGVLESNSFVLVEDRFSMWTSTFASHSEDEHLLNAKKKVNVMHLNVIDFI